MIRIALILVLLIVLLLLCLCNATVDIDKRTRGIPMDVSHEGNFFCFAFIRNKANIDPNIGREAPRSLGIFITTQNPNPVGYRIRSGDTDYARTGTVTAGTIVREQYMTPNVPEVNTGTNPTAGIIVETINSSQTIQVMGFSDSFGSADGFLAVPIIQYKSNFTYGYASLSASARSFNSIIGVVACSNIPAGDITYSTENPFLVVSNYIKDGFALQNQKTFPSATMSEFNTLGLLRASMNDVTGFRANSNQPIGFMTGHECGEIQRGEDTCDHIVEQIPPSYTWGYNFFLAPFGKRTGYAFKVWPRYEGTSFTVYCSDGTNFNISNFQFNESNVDNRQRFELNSQSYCCIQSERPLAVMQYGFSHEHDNNNQFGDPNMVLIAPISQYLNQHVFTTNVSMYTGQNDDFTDNFISVTVLARYFDPSAILLDDTPLETNTTKWSTINCGQNDPCGYGISKEVNIGTHRAQHTNPNASINVIVYGWQIEKGYAYPAGFGMNPVGETFYSLVALNESELENTRGPMVVRVYRSGDVSQSATVTLRTFTTMGQNAATIGTTGDSIDLTSQSYTVSFVSGQTFGDASFTFMDDSMPESDETFGVELVPRNDLNFGVPSRVVLTIIDDDSITIFFNPIQYNVTEGNTDVTVTLRAQTSQPLLMSSRIRITDQSTGSATRNEDYMAFDSFVDLQVGATGFMYNVTIRSNPEAEQIETFRAIMSFVSGGALTITQNTATVRISDDDGITIFFNPIQYNVTEGNTDVTVTLRAQTSQPLLMSSRIRITDQSTGSATRNEDYMAFDSFVDLQVGATGFMYNVTIRSNPEAEQIETFRAIMSFVSGGALTITQNTATVQISDDDGITIFFNPIQYNVTEGNTDVTVTLRAQTSQPLLMSSRIRITDQSTGSATRNEDYMAFDSFVDLQVGATGFMYNVTIRSNPEAEQIETFRAIMSFVSGGALTITQNTATVRISDDDGITIFFNPIQYNVTEGNTDVTVTLRAQTSQPLLMSSRIRITDQSTGSATRNEDYMAFDSFVDLQVGATGFMYNVTIRSNPEPEPTETFNAIMSFVSGGALTVTQNTATVRIIDIDGVTIGFTTDNYRDNENKGYITVNCTASGPVFNDVTLNIRDSPNTAQKPGDYSGFNQNIVIPQGQTSVLFNITITDDARPEPDEDFYAIISLVSGDKVSVDQTSATSTITIEDTDRSNIRYAAPNPNVNEERGYVTVSVSITEPYFEDFNIRVFDKQFSSPINGFAIRGSDYTGFDMNITISANQQEFKFNVTIIDDNVLELFEVFGLDLEVIGSPRVVRDPSVDNAQVSINDVDIITLAFNQSVYTVNEQATDTTAGFPVVVVNGATSIPIFVNLNYQDGSATGVGIDYNEGLATSIRFTPGLSSSLFQAIINSDNIDENTENFTIILEVPSGQPWSNRVMLSRPRAIVEISDSVEDRVTFNIAISSRNITVQEDGTAQICVTRTGLTDKDYQLTLQTATILGGATAPDDFPADQQTFLFPHNVNMVYRNFSIVDDNLALEGNEGFNVVLTSTTPGLVGSDNTALVNIQDNDNSYCSFGAPQYPGNEGSSQTVCLHLSNPIARSATVTLSQSPVPGVVAAEANDITGLVTTVTFTPNNQTECFVVTYVDDNIYETDEGLHLTINTGNSGLFTTTPSSTNLLISDNNPPTLIGKNNVTIPENAGVVTVCAEVAGNTVGTQVNIPITFTPKVLPPSGRDKAETNDFDQTPQTVILRPGQTQVCTNIVINRDNRQEDNETFCVDLSSSNTAVQFQPDTCQIRVTILDEIRCVNYLSDIMLVLDVSESLSSTEANQIKSFALNFVRQYPSISQTTTNIGMIRFSDEARTRVDIPLLEFNNKSQIEQKINNIDFRRDRGGKTYHLLAMTLALQEIAKGRSDARDIIILVTDGEPNPKNQSAIAISKDARENKNITIFGILIKPTPARIEEIRQISGNDTFFTIDRAADLTDLIADLTRTDCEAVTVRFETENVTIHESEGKVEVCLVKSGQSIDNIILDIGTRQRVPYRAGQDATIGEDFPYDRRTGVVFPRDAVRLCFFFNITDDDIGREPNEVFQIMFNITSSPNIAITDRPIANVTIIDNDVLSASFEFNSYPGNEGQNLSICVLLSHIPAMTVIIPLSTNPGPSLVPAEQNDYSGVPTSVSFTPPSKQTCFDVRLTDDNVHEPTEGFNINLNLGGTGVTSGMFPTTTVRIRDTDRPIITSETVVEEEAQGRARVCARLTGTTTTILPLSITFNPRVLTNQDVRPPGDLASNADFDTTTQTVTLNPGETEVCVNINIVRDNIEENDETFCVDLSSNNPAVQFQPNTCQSMVTILDEIRCVNYLSDIMLVLDVSESLNSTEARQIKSFALNFVSQYPSISQTTTNIGMIRFSDQARTQVDIKLREFNNKSQVEEKINSIDFHRNRGGKTYHLRAMTLALQEIATGRPEARDIIILVTDGEPNPKNQSAIAISKEARENKNITIFGILIKPNPTRIEEIRQISGNDTFFVIGAARNLTNLIADLTRTDCEAVNVRFETENVTVHESEGRVQVCLVKSGQSRSDFTLDIGTRQRVPYTPGQDATIGEDFPYDRRTGVVFPRDAVRLCFYFNITDDDIGGEPNEIFQITFNITSSPDVAVTDRPIANITILDDDVVKISFTTNDYCVSEDNGTVYVCLTKNIVAAEDVVIDVTASENFLSFLIGYAQDQRDFVAETKSGIVFLREQSIRCVQFTILDDKVYLERNETFDLTFDIQSRSTLAMKGTPQRAIVTIKDNEGSPFSENITIPKTGDNTVPESDKEVTVCLNRSVTIAFDVNVTFTSLERTSGDTRTMAMNIKDFMAETIVATLHRDSLSVCVTFTIIDDDIVEKDEMFLVNITVPFHRPDNLLATVVITDEDDTAELNIKSTDYRYPESIGDATVCVNTTKALSTDVNIRLNTSSATATANDDYTHISEIKVLPAGDIEVCFSIPITQDTVDEDEEYFRAHFDLANPTDVMMCYGNRVTVGSRAIARVYIIDDDERNQSLCLVEEPLKVSPFHTPGQSMRPMYNFHGICEHILAKPCNGTKFVVVADFLSRDLSTGRVGLQVPEGTLIIDENLNHIPQGLTIVSTNGRFEYTGGVIVTTEVTNSTVTKVTVALRSGDVSIERTSTSVAIYVRPDIELCGLCGNTNGTLVSSDGNRLTDLMNQTKVNAFANSWQRQPYQQVLREDRRECAVLKNDTIIGDPLYEAALWIGEELCKYALCYEIHGEAGKHFNLLSDKCVSVSAAYSSMSDPTAGNIISAIGIRASDDTNSCVNIDIVQDSNTGRCVTTVGGQSLSVGGEINVNGIYVKQRMMSRVRVSVPNCDKIPLVMWITCQNINNELMMRFDISRGVNLRPSSHGLLGQFWNIKLQAKKFDDQQIISQLDPTIYSVNDLWVITVTPPPRNGTTIPTREFVAELYVRAWDNSVGPCLYAGTGQGGAAVEFGTMYGDSVIEGKYSDYVLTSRFETDFAYSMFDKSKC